MVKVTCLSHVSTRFHATPSLSSLCRCRIIPPPYGPAILHLTAPQFHGKPRIEEPRSGFSKTLDFQTGCSFVSLVSSLVHRRQVETTAIPKRTSKPLQTHTNLFAQKSKTFSSWCSRWAGTLLNGTLMYARPDFRVAPARTVVCFGSVTGGRGHVTFDVFCSVLSGPERWDGRGASTVERLLAAVNRGARVVTAALFGLGR